MCVSPAELPADTEAVGLGSADSKNEALLRGQAMFQDGSFYGAPWKRDIAAAEEARNKTKTLTGIRCSDSGSVQYCSVLVGSWCPLSNSLIYALLQSTILLRD
jgi:hypothetical protein